MSGPAPVPDQKRSVGLAPGTVGTVAAVAVGGMLAADAFGAFSQSCRTGVVATSVAECSSYGSQDCVGLIQGGAPAVALVRTSDRWTAEPLRWSPTGGGYADQRGNAFPGNRTCRSTARTPHWYGWNSGRPAASQTQGTQRQGFGQTARSFSISTGT